MRTGKDYRYGLRGQGRPEGVETPPESAPIERKRRPGAAERQIDVEFEGLTHLVDTPAPYESLTIDHLNLEPHRGGYRVRYADEAVLTEPNQNRRPFAIVSLAGHLTYALHYFLKPNETKPLEWVRLTVRGNAAYVMLDDHVFLTMRYLGLVSDWNTNPKLVRADVGDVFFEEEGGYLQVGRNLFTFDRLVLREDGMIELYNVQPVAGVNDNTPPNPNDPILWVSRSQVQPAPSIRDIRWVTEANTSQTIAQFPFIAPLCATTEPLTFSATTLTIDTSNQTSPLPWLLYQAGNPPRMTEETARRDASTIWYSRGSAIYNHPNGGVGWVGLSVGDVATPKFQRITNPPSNPYSVVPTSASTPNEVFTDAINVPDWFRPHYLATEGAVFCRPGETTIDILTHVVDWNRMRASRVYEPGTMIRSGDWTHRFLRYPPRVRHTLGAAFFDWKDDIENNSWYEMGLMPPYRSMNDDRFQISRLYVLNANGDVFTIDGKAWTALDASNTPLSQANAQNQAIFLTSRYQYLAYGFKTLSHAGSRKVSVCARWITGDQYQMTRVVYRFINPEWLGTSVPVIMSGSVLNVQTDMAAHGQNHYTNHFKVRLVHEDLSPLGDASDPKLPPSSSTNPFASVEPKRFYYKVPNNYVYSYDISSINEPYYTITIPKLTLYNAGSELPEEAIAIYGVIGNEQGGFTYVPVAPKDEELTLFPILSIGRKTVRKEISPNEGGYQYVVKTLVLENLTLKVPKNATGKPYVGLELRVLTPGLSRELANGVSPQTMPTYTSRAAIAASGLDLPFYTVLEIEANTYVGSPLAASKRNYEFFFAANPPAEETPIDYQFTASVLHGDSWGKSTPLRASQGKGTHLEFDVFIPPSIDLHKASVQLLIGYMTSSGLKTIARRKLTSADLNQTITVKIPASQLNIPKGEFYQSDTSPTYGPIVTDALRIVVAGKSAAYLSHMLMGLAWHLRPTTAESGVVVPLPDNDMLLTKYQGKSFFVSGSNAYVLVTENALTATFLPTSAAVHVIQPRTQNDAKPFSNLIDGLLHVSEDGVYMAEEKILAFTERLPNTILGLYVLDLTHTPLIVVEKTDSIDIYQNDKQNAGFMRWDVLRNAVSERRINQIEMIDGYLYLVSPQGFGTGATALNPAHIVRVASATSFLPASRARYQSGALRSPVGLRARKMRVVFLEPETRSSAPERIEVRFYRKLIGEPNNSVVSTIRFTDNRTRPIPHRDHKLESLNIEVRWLDTETVIKRLELITYPGVNW